MSTFVDIHVLQTVPSSNLNRDDTGRPKTGIFGGVVRARVSSQAWKRATRRDFAAYLPHQDRAVRTRRIIQDLVERITTQAPEIAQDEAIEMAKAVMKAANSKISFKAPRAKKAAKGEEPEPVDPFDLSEYLLFVSNQQLDRLAALAIEGRDGTIDKAAAKDAIQLNNGIEVALFGRMVADDTSINVDASVQVAHALSTHAVEPEYDYFTAVDDTTKDSDPSAGMIGVIEFNSSTLYRYATINLTQLQENLGDDALAGRAVEAFVRSFLVSMPTGKQNTFANGTLPDAAVVQLRDRRPVNLVGAFELPVQPDGESALSLLSARRLAERASAVDAAFGVAPTSSYVLAADAEVAQVMAALGEGADLEQLVTSVSRDAVTALQGAS